MSLLGAIGLTGSLVFLFGDVCPPTSMKLKGLMLFYYCLILIHDLGNGPGGWGW